MKIAVCDDEKVAAEYIGGVLEAYFKDKPLECSVELYNSGEAMMTLQDEILTYDVVFLDVDMPDADGFEVAGWIRMFSDKIIIAFITAMISYSLKGYNYNAIRYIPKNTNQLEQSIYECMDAVLYRMNYFDADRKVFVCNQQKKEIILNNVMYIESSAHKVKFHIVGKEMNNYIINDKLNNIEKELGDYNYFIRVHQSYIVNMMYVRKISSYHILLDNGVDIGVLKARYKEVKKAILEFKAKL